MPLPPGVLLSLPPAAPPAPGYRVWVANYGSNSISVFNPDGSGAKNADGSAFQPPATIGGQTLAHPVGICAVGTEVWVACNAATGRIFVYDAATGAGITTFTTGVTPWASGLWRVDDNEVWCGSNTNNQINVLDARGDGANLVPNLLRLASTPSVPDHGVVLPNGDLWICSVLATSTVKRYTHSGAAIATLTIGSYVTHLAVVGDQVWVVSNGDGKIYRYDFAGNALSTITTGLSNIRGACVVGNVVWVTYGTTGTAMAAYNGDGSVASLPTAPGGLSSPYHLCTVPSAPLPLPAAPSIVSQVTVAADGGTVQNYEAGIVQCADSSNHLLIACTEFTASGSNDGRVFTQSSTDGGTTWGAKSYIVARSAGHSYQVGCMGILTQGAHAGRIIVSYFDYNGTTGVAIYTLHSDDNGSTWSTPASQTPFSGSLQAVQGNILQLANGDVLLPVYGTNTGDTQDRCGLVRSTDGGGTWGSLVTIAGGSSPGYNECCLVQETSGVVTCYLRSDNDLYEHVCTSSDNGATWSAVTQLWSVGQSGSPCVAQVPGSGMRLFFYRSANASPAFGYRYSPNAGYSWSGQLEWPGPGGTGNYYLSAYMVGLSPGVVGVAACASVGSACNIYFLKMQANG